MSSHSPKTTIVDASFLRAPASFVTQGFLFNIYNYSKNQNEASVKTVDETCDFNPRKKIVTRCERVLTIRKIVVLFDIIQ